MSLHYRGPRRAGRKFPHDKLRLHALADGASVPSCYECCFRRGLDLEPHQPSGAADSGCDLSLLTYRFSAELPAAGAASEVAARMVLDADAAELSLPRPPLQGARAAPPPGSPIAARAKARVAAAAAAQAADDDTEPQRDGSRAGVGGDPSRHYLSPSKAMKVTLPAAPAARSRLSDTGVIGGHATHPETKYASASLPSSATVAAAAARFDADGAWAGGFALSPPPEPRPARLAAVPTPFRAPAASLTVPLAAGSHDVQQPPASEPAARDSLNQWLPSAAASSSRAAPAPYVASHLVSKPAGPAGIPAAILGYQPPPPAPWATTPLPHRTAPLPAPAAPGLRGPAASGVGAALQSTLQPLYNPLAAASASFAPHVPTTQPPAASDPAGLSKVPVGAGWSVVQNGRGATTAVAPAASSRPFTAPLLPPPTLQHQQQQQQHFQQKQQQPYHYHHQQQQPQPQPQPQPRPPSDEVMALRLQVQQLQSQLQSVLQLVAAALPQAATAAAQLLDKSTLTAAAAAAAAAEGGSGAGFGHAVGPLPSSAAWPLASSDATGAEVVAEEREGAASYAWGDDSSVGAAAAGEEDEDEALRPSPRGRHSLSPALSAAASPPGGGAAGGSSFGSGADATPAAFASGALERPDRGSLFTPTPSPPTAAEQRAASPTPAAAAAVAERRPLTSSCALIATPHLDASSRGAAGNSLGVGRSSSSLAADAMHIIERARQARASLGQGREAGTTPLIAGSGFMATPTAGPTASLHAAIGLTPVSLLVRGSGSAFGRRSAKADSDDSSSGDDGVESDSGEAGGDGVAGWPTIGPLFV